MKTFWSWFWDLVCITAQEEPDYRGFSKATIEILNVHDCFSGWFTERR